ncbi:MAG: tyrosine-type recombinase/integrase [Bacillaceae bacterium]
MGAVVQFNKEYEVYNEFISYINMAHLSENTKKTYSTGIRDFFREIKNKEIEHLTWDDLNIKKKDVEAFRTKLKEKGQSNNTINNKVAGLRGFYNELASNDYDVNTKLFAGLKKLPDDTDSYDPFTVEEVLRLSELALEEQRKGINKSKFILFCLDTCIRKTAALNLKWSDLEVLEDSEEVKINAIDKGNKDFRAKIHYDFYKELLTLKGNSEYVFDLTKDSVDKMMPRLIQKLNTNTERNLVFHSIRKTGVEFKYRYTGDIKVAQKAANHVDPSLTFKTYIDSEDYGVYGAVSKSKDNKESILNTLNHEQLMTLLGNLDTDLLLRVEKKAKELFYS